MGLNWLQKISQSWGYKSRGDSQLAQQLTGRSQWSLSTETTSRLQQIDPNHVELLVSHMAEKWFPGMEIEIESAGDMWFLEQGDAETYAEEHTEARELRQSELTAIVDNLLNKSGVGGDREFVSRFHDFIYKEIEQHVANMYIQNSVDKPFYVRIYGVKRAYGGAEEGGWWYDQPTFVKQEIVQGFHQAAARKNHLQQEYENKGEDTFYQDLESGHGGVRDWDDLDDEYPDMAGGMEQEGMSMPLGWSPSGFEKYEITVERLETPRKQERPYYQ